MDLTLEPDMYDPDPAVRARAVIAFLDGAIGRPFLERWTRMNDCEEWMAERQKGTGPTRIGFAKLVAWGPGRPHDKTVLGHVNDLPAK